MIPHQTTRHADLGPTPPHNCVSFANGVMGRIPRNDDPEVRSPDEFMYPNKPTRQCRGQHFKHEEGTRRRYAKRITICEEGRADLEFMSTAITLMKLVGREMPSIVSKLRRQV